MERPVSRALRHSGNARAAARELGLLALAKASSIREILDHRASISYTAMQDIAALVSSATQGLDASADPVSSLLDDDLGERIRLIESNPPAAAYAVLLGLCQGTLSSYFATTRDEGVEIDRGDPIPLPTRPTHTAYPHGTCTPNPRTMAKGHLLSEAGFTIFGGSEVLNCRLDFSARRAIDQVAWIGDESSGQFPKVATVHPLPSPEALKIDEVTDTYWFGVAPDPWEKDRLLDQLRRVSDVPIAVIPELTLPESDALAADLSRDPHSYPRLIVAGSAHIQGDDGDRFNEGALYLDGYRLLPYRKVHRFETRYLGERHPRPLAQLPEGITRRTQTLTVACGSRTRLAVVICADLNDRTIPGLLADLGVNFLLVPALTPSLGAFAQSAGAVTGGCQGVAVVANGAPLVDPATDSPEPFLVFTATPRANPLQNGYEYTHPDGERRAIAVLDLNRDMGQAVQWLDDESAPSDG